MLLPVARTTVLYFHNFSLALLLTNLTQQTSSSYHIGHDYDDDDDDDDDDATEEEYDWGEKEVEDDEEDNDDHDDTITDQSVEEDIDEVNNKKKALGNDKHPHTQLTKPPSPYIFLIKHSF